MNAKTAKALTEMMSPPAKQFAGYEGPLVITMIGGRRPESRRSAQGMTHKERVYGTHPAAVASGAAALEP